MNMNKIGKYLLIICVWLISTPVFSYVHSLTTSGKQIQWPANSSTIEVYFNPDNSHGLDTSTLQTIVSNSVAQWNNISSINVRYGTTAGKNQAGVNEIYFSNDNTIFNGSGVVGVTNCTYSNETDGIILSADILINDTNFFSFSTNVLNDNFIGNVVTHEMGHFLGLGHSQVLGSTMFYALSLGQSQLADDDKSGIYSIYPNADVTKKTISGKVVGSKNLYGVFGVNVQAISQNSGKVMGADVTGVDGKFNIMGLPINDKYFIYTSYLLQANEPSFYGTTKNNFCDTGTSYRGSFFQACGGSNEGYPQSIALTSSDVDVGNITIRCSLDVPPDYIQKKSGTGTLFDLIPNIDNGIGNSFVGYFSNTEMNNGTNDTFLVDLTYVTPTQWNSLSASNLFLQIQVINQNFYSPFKANVSIIQNGQTTTLPSKYIQNADGEININTTTYVAIDKTNSANNIFDIKISPESMKGLAFPSGIPFTKDQVFPANSIFEDSMYFYLVNAQVVKLNGDGTYSQVSSRSYQVSDNTNCPDASGTYQLTSYTTGTNQSSGKRSSPLSCGTIDTGGNDHDNHSGPLGLLIGFSFIAFIFMFKKKSHFI